MIKGKEISLRAPEPEDLDVLYAWENNVSIWYLSNTNVPFSRHLLQEYILSAQADIYSARQLRLMIVKNENSAVMGAVDLFDFDPHNLRAGIGILIDEKFRKKGYATQALELLLAYCRNILNLHQVYCNIVTENKQSISLFEKLGFQCIGVKKQWIRKDGKWFDENSYQLIFQN